MRDAAINTRKLCPSINVSRRFHILTLSFPEVAALSAPLATGAAPPANALLSAAGVAAAAAAVAEDASPVEEAATAAACADRWLRETLRMWSVIGSMLKGRG